jgi:hypothetical protein
MAKHSKKKIIFNFLDTHNAENFLELVQRKKMYANVTASMNPSGKLEFTLIGSPENIKITVQKLKKLHKNVIHTSEEKQTSQKEEEEEEELDLKLKLKKLKF